MREFIEKSELYLLFLKGVICKRLCIRGGQMKDEIYYYLEKKLQHN